MAQMRAAVPSNYHSLLPSGTPLLLPIRLPVPSTHRRAEILEADTPPRKRLLLTAVGNKMHKAFPLLVIKFPLAEEVPTASHEHYALWEVIEFGDSYEVPTNDPSTTTTNTTSGEAGTKSRRTVTLTTEDIQKKKNDTSVNESDAKTSENTSCESDSNVETTTSMPALVENAPKVVCKPKVWTDAPIITKYESDSDDDSMSNVQEDKEKPSFPFTDFVKHVKPSRENVKETSTPNHFPKFEKQGRNGHTRKGLVYAFTRKSCFVCGSFSHLIRDYDFHEKRIAKQAELTINKNKVIGQQENRPVWNNVQRVNHQNKFVPSAILTKTVDQSLEIVFVGNKMHKAFPLPAIKFPLPEELPTTSEDGSHCQKKRDATARKIALLSMRITFNTHLTFTFKSKQDMDQQYPTVAKIPILDKGKFKQWQFRMQQYLQHEHYALWEVIEFGDSYEVPANDPSTTTTNTTCGEAGTKSGRTVTLTTKDIQKKKNDATKKTKKNLLKQQCGNFRAEGSETLEQTFTRLGRRDNYRQGTKAEEQAPKALMEIDGVGWDWSYMANDEEDHALVVDEEAPTEFALMANTSTESKVFDNSLCSKDCKKNNDSLNSKIIDLTDKLFDAKNMIYHYKLALAQVESRLVEYKEREVKYIEKIRTLEYYHKSKKECIETLKKELETLKQEKEVVDGKLAGLLTASKDFDNLIESQRSDKCKEECADDTVTDYSRPSPTIESSSEDDQNRNPSVSKNVASPITPKPFVKFVKESDSRSKSKTDEKETPKKPPVKYAKQYRKPNKKPNVRGNKRN
nr:hypothetical protein [Tanacetum cinerariifolium]